MIGIDSVVRSGVERVMAIGGVEMRRVSAPAFVPPDVGAKREGPPPESLGSIQATGRVGRFSPSNPTLPGAATPGKASPTWMCPTRNLGRFPI